MKKLAITLSILALIVSSCGQTTKKQEVSSDVNNEQSISEDKTNPLMIIQNKEAVNCVIQTFKPLGLTLQLTDNRPQKCDSSVFLCVPAAFTDKNTKIDGICIIEGKTINSISNNTTGICVIASNGIEMMHYAELTSDLLESVKNNQSSLFQQVLLIKASKIIPCGIWGDLKYKRRALIKFEVGYAIGESDSKMTIEDFQKALIHIGAVDAVYLDMGSWSEGWYRKDNGEVITIGEAGNMGNTSKQTNWIVFI